ncbi:MAG TPA: TRAP transporter substrate-binding protein DctP [Spirochaetota bacterium]|nr:TRAP transporter substrate-binding protein DctP [Spirochaetota bacterium]HOL57219.1 TRAP transporter substrate-binding protein DctP [Spirochaetota bacterium]HPP04854.1 TRAP transporter substrate-binding protein DctP [Spirochaetota bacterium]
MCKKNLIFIILFLALNILNPQAKYIFQIATDAPEGSSWVKTLLDINEDIKKYSKGQVEIKVFAGSTMGDQSSVIKKIKMGQLSGAGLSSGGAQLIYKDFGILGFPMIFKNYDEYDYIVKEFGYLFEQEFEKNGFILAAWSEVGLIYIFSKKKVDTLDALRNAKPFIMEGDQVSIVLFEEAKIKPVQTKMSDIITDLNTGRIETVFSSTYALIATQWFTKVYYMADFPITLMIGAVVLDKKLFDSMPKNYQVELRRLFKEHFARLTQKVRKDNEDAREILVRKAGIKILPIDQKQKEIFYRLAEKASDRLTQVDYSRDLYLKIKEKLEEYRKNKNSN